MYSQKITTLKKKNHNHNIIITHKNTFSISKYSVNIHISPIFFLCLQLLSNHDPNIQGLHTTLGSHVSQMSVSLFSSVGSSSISFLSVSYVLSEDWKVDSDSNSNSGMIFFFWQVYFIGDSVFLHQEECNSLVFLFFVWWPFPRSIILLEMCKMWYSDSIVPSPFN